MALLLLIIVINFVTIVVIIIIIVIVVVIVIVVIVVDVIVDVIIVVVVIVVDVIVDVGRAVVEEAHVGGEHVIDCGEAGSVIAVCEVECVVQLWAGVWYVWYRRWCERGRWCVW